MLHKRSFLRSSVQPRGGMVPTGILQKSQYAPKVPHSRRCMRVATSKRVATMRNRGLRCGRVVAGAGPKVNPDENAICATERFAQVEIPYDFAPAICTGRNSVRFCAREVRREGLRKESRTKNRPVQLKDLYRSIFHPIPPPRFAQVDIPSDSVAGVAAVR